MKMTLVDGTVVEGTPKELDEYAGYAEGDDLVVSAGDIKVSDIATGCATSANKKPTRAEVVAKAKKDVEELLSDKYAGISLPTCVFSYWPEIGGGERYFPIHKVRFEVHRKKRTVKPEGVALGDHIFAGGRTRNVVNHISYNDYLCGEFPKCEKGSYYATTGNLVDDTDREEYL